MLLSNRGGEYIKALILLKGIIIGIVVCIPVGPLGFLSIQRTIREGRKIGFLSGIGAAISDLVYSSIAVFGMTFIDDFISLHQSLINLITGLIFLAVGTLIILKTNKNNKCTSDIIDPNRERNKAITTVASTFFMGLSNPMTFFIFLVVFAKMGITMAGESFWLNILFIFSILTGSALLWLIITSLINIYRNNFNVKIFVFIDKIIGIMIITFGIVSIIKSMLVL